MFQSNRNIISPTRRVLFCTALFLTLLVCLSSTVNANSDNNNNNNNNKSGALALDPSTFHKTIKDPTKYVFVMFHASWCHHCLRLRPKWDAFADSVRDVSNVIIAEIDAAEHRSIGEEYNIRGFPTLKLFTKGNKDGVAYEGPRDVTALTSFLKSFMTE